MKVFSIMSGWAAVIVLSAGGVRAAGSPAKLHIGDPAPALTVAGWVKGVPVQKFEKGHVYVLDFWATWCVPCRESMPHMTQLARQYRGKAIFIAMNVSETLRPGQDLGTVVDTFVKRMGDKLDVNVAYDTDGSANRNWMKAAGMGSIPTVFIVDQEGKLAWIGEPGGVEDSLARIVAGGFDREAFRQSFEQKKASQDRQRDAVNALSMPMYQALMAKDYHLALSEYDKVVAASSEYKALFMPMYVEALIHVDADKAYVQATSAAGGSEEQEAAVARIFAAQPGLAAKFYDFAIDYFSRRVAKDPFALEPLAAAHFHSGGVAKAIEIQRRFVENLRSPASSSSVRYLTQQEEALKQYEAAAAGKTGFAIPPPTELEPLSMNARLSVDKAKPGDTLTLTIGILLFPGWHIYAEVPPNEPYVQTRWILDLPPGLVPIGEWISPPPTPDGQNPQLKLHESGPEPLLVVRQVKVVDAIPAQLTVRAGLSYQTCDVSRCLPPDRKTVDLTIRIGTK